MLPMSESKYSFRWYVLQLMASAAGAVTSLYLLVQHTRLKLGIQGGSFCDIGRFADCSAVNASQFSEVRGIPLAAFGVLYFLCVFVLIAAQSPSKKGFRRAQMWAARLGLLALAVDVWLLAVQVFFLKTTCLLCLFTYLCTLTFLAGGWLLQNRPRTWKTWLSGERKPAIAPLALALCSVTLFASAIGMYQYVQGSYSSARLAMQEQSKKVFLETWSSRPSKNIPLSEPSYSWGNPQGKVRIVVFSDFECPHCQRAAFALHTALSSMEDQVLLVFKNFPLDMSCNPLLKQAIHKSACPLAFLGYCAQQKKRFWDFHDRVFFKLSAREISDSTEALYNGVKPLFTRKEFDDCLQNPAALASVREDIELGKTLEVDATPAIFINGKRVAAAPTVDLIRELVQRELNSN